MKGFQAIAELLRREDVDTVFSMLGSTNIPWIAQGVESGAFRLVKTRHEETCVAAAAGYAKSTGRIGVCGVTRGPGFANSVNALVAATRSHVPLLLLVGESTNQRATQNLDQEGITRAIGAAFFHVGDASELESAFSRAAASARMVGVPHVVSIADAVLEGSVQLSSQSHRATLKLSPPDPISVSAVVDALATAKRPLIIAGQGAVISESRDVLIRLADACGASLANTLNANRFFSGHPRDLGLCGSWSPSISRDYIAKTDLVLAFGASMNKHTMAEGHAFGSAVIVHCEVDVEAECQATYPELALLGDSTACAEALLDEWKRRGLTRRDSSEPVPDRFERATSLLKKDLGHNPASGLDLRVVYRALDEKLDSSRIVVTDAGRHLGVLPSLVDAQDARSWITSRGYGSVGLGLGAAIGAAAGNPDRPVVLFCGDGGFMMAAQELDTIRIHDLSVTIFVMNDEQYGAEVAYLDKYGLVSDVVHWPLPNIQALAATYGGVGVVIDSEEALELIEIPRRGLAIFDVRIDPAVDGGGSSFLGAFG